MNAQYHCMAHLWGFYAAIVAIYAAILDYVGFPHKLLSSYGGHMWMLCGGAYEYLCSGASWSQTAMWCSHKSSYWLAPFLKHCWIVSSELISFKSPVKTPKVHFSLKHSLPLTYMYIKEELDRVLVNRFETDAACLWPAKHTPMLNLYRIYWERSVELERI